VSNPEGSTPSEPDGLHLLKHNTPKFAASAIKGNQSMQAVLSATPQWVETHHQEPKPLNLHIAAFGVSKAYQKGEHQVPVLRGVDIAVQRGEFLSIIGQSGSGKSTLLHVLGLLDSPDAGEIHLGAQRIDDLAVKTRDELRNRVFGFVFQFYHLLPELNVLENVLAPLMIRESMWTYWKNRRTHAERAKHFIHKVGLSHRLTHRPSELSGGELQRAAIARALVGQPQILLADEPTGNLDERTGREILDLLAGLNSSEKLTILMVTHDKSIAAEAHRMVRLTDGRIEGLENR
jgi:lipoprotein-releasing system ATP-binding protein